VVVSAGDSGSAGCDDPDNETLAYLGLAVNGLASTPYNVAVGGTDFDILYSSFPGSFTKYVDITNTLPNHRSALKYISEEPWNDSTYPNAEITSNIAINRDPSSASGDNIIAGGGGGNAGTSAGTYTVTVSGTGTSSGSAGSVTATVGSFTLTVN